MQLKNLKTKFIGRNFIYLETIDSTQKYIKERSIEELKNGSLVLAEIQTDGVGTHERKWYTGTNKENIAMSFVLYPNTNLNKFNKLTIIIAECILDSIKKLYGYELDIKEPNDIIYKEKKIAGILTECKTKGEIVTKIVIGIGININQVKFPENLENIASSLKKEFGKNFSREKIIIEFLNRFEKEYLKILENKQIF